MKTNIPRSLAYEKADVDYMTQEVRVAEEYAKAVEKHPNSTWPKDVIHMVAIMAEEAGEAVQAANDVVHQGASLEPLRKELAQTAAMCIRCLVNLENRV